MKRSFTVTELLVAIAIVVILAGILIGGIGYAGRRADEAKTIAAIQTLSAALDAYRAENGYYPPAISNFWEVKFYRDSTGVLYLSFVSGTSSKDYKFVDKKQGKPFLEFNVTGTTKEAFTDAWGNALRYRCPGTHNKGAFDLFSYGSDKKSSTADEKQDDIANWDNASQQ